MIFNEAIIMITLKIPSKIIITKTITHLHDKNKSNYDKEADNDCHPNWKSWIAAPTRICYLIYKHLSQVRLECVRIVKYDN